MTDKELGEAILKGLKTTEETKDFYYHQGCSCALGLALVSVLGTTYSNELIKRTSGNIFDAIIEQLKITKELGRQISREHHLGIYTAREIAQRLIEGKYSDVNPLASIVLEGEQ